MVTAKELGDDGENFSKSLLESKGFGVRKLPTNSRTYDLAVKNGNGEFFVSVKVARNKQHVRLGTRNSVLGLVPGNFVFAFIPEVGGEIETLSNSMSRLMILPAEMVRDDALSVHEKYWIDRGRDPIHDRTTFSVMVKGYGSHHKAIWPKWLTYRDAWNLLP